MSNDSIDFNGDIDDAVDNAIGEVDLTDIPAEPVPAPPKDDFRRGIEIIVSVGGRSLCLSLPGAEELKDVYGQNASFGINGGTVHVSVHPAID